MTIFIFICLLLRFLINYVYVLRGFITELSVIINNLIPYPVLDDSILLASSSDDKGNNTNNGDKDSEPEDDSDISEGLDDDDSVLGTTRVVDELDLLDKARKGDPQAKKEIEQRHFDGKPATEKDLEELEKFIEDSYYIQDDKEKVL